MTPVMSVDELNAFMQVHFPQRAADFIVERLADGVMTIRMPVGEADLRPGGTISGPTMFALADVGAYLATLALIGPQALAVTTNCSIDFMRKPAGGADLRAEARVLKLGKQLSVTDVLIFSDGMAAPVARATLTYALPPKRG